MNLKTTEPALIVGAIVAAISMAGTLGYSLLSPDQAGLWVLAVNAVAAAVMAWTTRPISPGVFTYLIGVIATLVAAYGFTVSPEQINGLNVLTISILTLITRGQVSPADTRITKGTEAVGKPEVQTVPDAR